MVTILQGDCREILKTLEPKSVHVCVTSPPYYGLRDYQVASQIGLEQTPEIYVQNLVEVFREVRRILRDDGTVWLNLGDSYQASGGGAHKNWHSNPGLSKSAKRNGISHDNQKTRHDKKTKDLLGIPWRVAFALQSDGWYLRSDVIWHKPNPMPESVEDRPTKSHEYIFLLAKSEKYFYDGEAIKEKQSESSFERAKYGWNGRTEDNSNGARSGSSFKRMAATGEKILTIPIDGYRNKRSVWTIATTPYTGAHFATYPPELIAPCIQAGTSEHGCCPKCGAPWERVVNRTPADVKSPHSNYGYGADRNDGGRSMLVGAMSTTIGWQPTCKCYNWEHCCDCGNEMTKHDYRYGDALDCGHNICSDCLLQGGAIDHECDMAPTPCTVLDPFAGSGTTGEVCEKLGRNSILIELNPAYIELIKQRTGQMGLFAG